MLLSILKEFQKMYLVTYNLIQFIGFTYVLFMIGIRYANLEYHSSADTYEHVGPVLKFLQLIMYLEVIHPIIGFTKGAVLNPLVQVSVRAFVLNVIIDAEPRMQTKPEIFYLFIIWSSIEVIRYPFYIAQLFKKEIYLLTWLRYTMWGILYPLGGLFESIIILRSIPYFKETQRFTVSMPNEWNFMFHLPSVLLIYVWVFSFPGLCFVMSHMHKLRTVKLRPEVLTKKCK